jgi:hypothetical protein
VPKATIVPNSEKLPEKQVAFAPKSKPPQPVQTTGGEKDTRRVPWFQKRSA